MGLFEDLLRRAAIIVAITAAFACVAAASASAAPLLWAVNSAKGTVSTFEGATGRGVGTPIGTGATPDSIAITPDGGRAYVANSVGESVTVIETGTRIPIKTISLTGPAKQIATSPGGKTVYVTIEGSERVFEFSTGSNTEVGSILAGLEASALAVTPNGEFAYVGIGPEDVQMINLRTGAKVGLPVEVGGFPQAIAFSPDGKTAYVAAGNEVDVLEGGAVVKKIAIGSAASNLAVSPDATRLYVTSGPAKTVTTIEIPSGKPVGLPIAIEGEPEEIALTADGRTAYVASGEAITPIDLTTGIKGTKIETPGSGVFQLVVAPDQPPVAAFEPPQANTGIPVTFSGALSTDPDGAIASYQWSLNDAAAPTGLTVTHTFLNPGTYFTSLTVTDEEGCSVAQVFTGRTAYCNGSGVASVTHPVSVTTPPIVCSAARRLRFGSLLHNRKNGTARLQVRLPSAGSIFLFGKKVHAVTRKAKKAGSMFLTLHARVELNKRLKKIHRTSVRIRVTFAPTGGCSSVPKTVHRSVSLLRAPRKKHHGGTP